MRGIERVFAILTDLGSDPGRSLSEVADSVGLPRPTALRMLRALQGDGWVYRDSDGRYRLGPAVVALASQYTMADTLLARITPMMRELRDELGESISLCRVSGTQRLCIQEFPSVEDLRLVLGLGAYGPLHAGASGLVLLAHLPVAERDEIIDGPRDLYTSRTIDTAKALRRECDKIRDRGWSVTVGQRTAGGVAAAVVVPDEGAPHGVSALGVYGPKVRCGKDDPERWIELLQARVESARTAS